MGSDDRGKIENYEQACQKEKKELVEEVNTYGYNYKNIDDLKKIGTKDIKVDR
ncbi:hypothetical protein STFE110948_04395 [Streptobacillus felis]